MAPHTAACPRCGANVQLFPQNPSATCTYCGTTFPRPAVGAAKPASLPVGCLLGGVALLVLVLGGTGAAVFALRAAKQGKATSTTTTSTGPAVPEQPLEQAAAQPPSAARKLRPPRLETRHAPLFADLNGDGSADVVAAASTQDEDGMKRRYVAFDGRSGAELWRSGDIGSDLFNSSAALEHGRLMVVNRTGKMTAYDARTGAEQWQAALGERVLAVCKAKEPDTLRVQTADERTLALDTRTGATKPAGKAPCERANTNLEERFNRDVADRSDRRAPAGVKSVVCGGVRVMGDRNFSLPDQCKAQFRVDPDKLPGMSARALWQHQGGVLVFGSKQPGTRVPMVGFFKGGKFVWSSDVPAREPLEAREGAPDHVALEGGRLFVAYEPQAGDKPASVTAFDVASGARLWNSTLPGKLRSVGSLRASGDGVVISAGDNLIGLGAADGKQRFAIGDGD